ncbi:hypothetical protein [Salipiger thiooxidans]|uniref:hypothetical protein n=1 Tax=Salipiger thiooxidans TaxID=282683 RepID=UPI001CD46CC4|nr:hypothetical protein [Salipiger thiooxidans]MCA0849141.1 hypothetical protein [Salipiger thiooxidans]
MQFALRGASQRSAEGQSGAAQPDLCEQPLHLVLAGHALREAVHVVVLVQKRRAAVGRGQRIGGHPDPRETAVQLV